MMGKINSGLKQEENRSQQGYFLVFVGEAEPMNPEKQDGLYMIGPISPRNKAYKIDDQPQCVGRRTVKKGNVKVRKAIMYKAGLKER